jgi:hypothetical protein
MEIMLHAFLTSTLSGVQVQIHASAVLAQSSHWIGGGWLDSGPSLGAVVVKRSLGFLQRV